MTLWEGRFEGGPAEALQALNDSLGFDQRMFREDIAGSRAHVRMLCTVGLLDEAERDEVLAALDLTETELAEGRFEFAVSDEDIHTAIERRVSELAVAGAKLHTGRSRNDQVATDLRLWTKAAVDEVIGLVLDFQDTLLRRADEVGDAVIPGYTHLQQAQPVMLAHHLLAHGWALSRDVERLVDARHRVDVSVLGAGALAGSSLPLDPTETAEALGFAEVFENSLDAVSDRDFVAEVLFVLSLLGVHLSRLGEELVLWSSTEFGFVELDDAFSTGSSMMPQKKNPDIAELARGKAGRLIGNLTGLLAALKGLPLTYNKDLQEDKEPLFDGIDTVRLVLLALDGMVSTTRFRIDVMAAAAASPYAAATDLAELLVVRGVPFRDAHGIVGDLVRRALAGESTLADLVAADDRLGPDAVALLEPGASVRNRTTRGGGDRSPWPHSSNGSDNGSLSSEVAVPASPEMEVLDGGRARRRRLDRAFYSRPALEVAPELLNKVIVSGGCAGRIVEVEAYCGGDDPGSHAFRGPTPRTATMFGPPGHLYVYFSYGMHWCANVVVERAGTAGAVLMRALTPLNGLDEIKARRPAAKRGRDLCNGPAKLTQALAIDGSHDGVDLVRAEREVTIVDDGTGPPARPGQSTRVGLTKGVDLPWRWFVDGIDDVGRHPVTSPDPGR